MKEKSTGQVNCKKEGSIFQVFGNKKRLTNTNNERKVNRPSNLQQPTITNTKTSPFKIGTIILKSPKKSTQPFKFFDPVK